MIHNNGGGTSNRIVTLSVDRHDCTLRCLARSDCSSISFYYTRESLQCVLYESSSVSRSEVDMHRYDKGILQLS